MLAHSIQRLQTSTSLLRQGGLLLAALALSVMMFPGKASAFTCNLNPTAPAVAAWTDPAAWLCPTAPGGYFTQVQEIRW